MVSGDRGRTSGSISNFALFHGVITIFGDTIIGSDAGLCGVRSLRLSLYRDLPKESGPKIRHYRSCGIIICIPNIYVSSLGDPRSVRLLYGLETKNTWRK